MEFCVLAKEV